VIAGLKGKTGFTWWPDTLPGGVNGKLREISQGRGATRSRWGKRGVLVVLGRKRTITSSLFDGGKSSGKVGFPRKGEPRLGQEKSRYLWREGLGFKFRQGTNDKTGGKKRERGKSVTKRGGVSINEKRERLSPEKIP